MYAVLRAPKHGVLFPAHPFAQSSRRRPSPGGDLMISVQTLLPVAGLSPVPVGSRVERPLWGPKLARVTLMRGDVGLRVPGTSTFGARAHDAARAWCSATCSLTASRRDCLPRD